MKKNQTQKIADWQTLCSPLLDRHNDYIEVYYRRTAQGYEFTDDGYTLADLEMSGYDPQGEALRERIAAEIERYGLLRQGDQLTAHTTAPDPEAFGLQFATALQAIHQLPCPPFA